MKISSIQQPPKFDIQRLPDGTYQVVLNANITQRTEHDDTGKDITMYDYDRYMVKAAYGVNLAVSIDADYDSWVQKAKDAEREAEAAKVREYRDDLLNRCDLKHCNPEKWAAMSDTEKLAWAAYKQALRDVPTQTTFPYSVAWPVPPADTAGKLSDALTADQVAGQQLAALSLSDAEKDSLIKQLGAQVVQAQLDLAALKGGASS